MSERSGGRYRKLYVRLWRHPGFLKLTDAEKVLAFYILTGPQSNRIGLFIFSIATASEDLGTLPETLTKRFASVTGTFGWTFDKGSRLLFIPSWFRWNPPENVNVLKGSLKDLSELPSSGLLDAFAANLETLPETLRGAFIEGLDRWLPKRSPIQEQYPLAVTGGSNRNLRARKTAAPNGEQPDTRLLAAVKDALKRSSIERDGLEYVTDTVRQFDGRLSTPKAEIELAIALVLAEQKAS